MAKIALTAICKNEEENLGRMLASVMPYVDAAFIVDTGSTDKTVEIAKNFGATVIEAGDRFIHPIYDGGIPIFNFDEARNFALEQIPDEYEYFIWLDADDELVGGENIRKVMALMEEGKIEAMFFRYIYYADFDEKGQIRNINIEHLRERVVKKGAYKWIGKLHETLIENAPSNKSDSQDMVVIHHTNWDQMTLALDRNITTLQEIVISEDGHDPRNVYYLGKTLFDLHEPILSEYVKGLFLQYLDTSGWAEERGQAWMYLAQLHLELSQIDEAIRATLMSMYENSITPEAYVVLALAYVAKTDWKKAMHWARLASLIELPKTTLAFSPRDLQTRILEVIFICSINTGRFEEAKGALEKLKAIHPDDKSLEEKLAQVNELIADNAVANSVVNLVNYHINHKSEDQIGNVIQAIPQRIANEPVMTQIRNQFTPPKVWGDDEIVIYCGPGFEKWSYKNIDDGIGGSEAAVIYMARSLAKLGKKVTIYGDPQELEMKDGENITYKNFYSFNPKDEFNVLIAWRHPGIFDSVASVKQRYVWAHDIINPYDYTPERLEKIDKIFCLSKWQGEELAKKTDKIYYTKNGIPA